MNRMQVKALSALAAGMLAVPLAANAALVTQLIHFDDAKNGWKWYSDVDGNFLFDPTNLQSSSLCADSTNGGNGSCVIEGKQGVLPKMTRPSTGPQSQGSSNDDPIVSGTELFTLDSFYFLLTGKGTGAKNAITVTGSNNVSFTFAMGTSWDTSGAPDVTFYEGTNAGQMAGLLTNQTGYIVTFGDKFKDVIYIQFSAPTTAQVRLDCVVATFDGTTTQSYNSATTCGIGGSSGSTGSTGSTGSNGSAGNVSTPGTSMLTLLGLGMMGMAFRGRRQRPLQHA